MTVVNEIRVQVVPFIDGHDDKVSVTFVGNVDRNNLVTKLIVEVVHGRDLWILWWIVISRRFVIGIKDVDGVLTRSRRWWKLITEEKIKNS